MSSKSDTDKSKPLSSGERKDLEKQEQIIASWDRRTLRAGEALKVIRDGQLFRGPFDSFDEYVQERWSIGKSRASQLISAAETLNELVEFTRVNLPTNERQIRPLLKLERKRQRLEAWLEAVRRAKPVDGVKHITARHVNNIVREFLLNESIKAGDAGVEMVEIKLERVDRRYAERALGLMINDLWRVWPEGEIELLSKRLKELSELVLTTEREPTEWRHLTPREETFRRRWRAEAGLRIVRHPPEEDPDPGPCQDVPDREAAEVA